jgi:hypothetical protein
MKRPFLTTAALFLCFIAAPSISTRAAEPVLVFSVKMWEGDYTSEDVPAGVKSTPTLGAIYTISADGGMLKKIVSSGKGTDYPTASPDGHWVYFQSKMDGAVRIYRCKWDGTGVTSLTPPDQLTKRLKG